MKPVYLALKDNFEIINKFTTDLIGATKQYIIIKLINTIIKINNFIINRGYQNNILT